MLLRQTGWRIADRFRERKKTGPHHQPLPNPMGEGGPRPGEGRFGDVSTGTATVNRIPDPASLDVNGLWEDEWERHVMRLALERVKEKVSVKQFQMFDLLALQGLCVSATARAVGVSMASVYMAKSRVARLVRKEVERLARGQTG